MRYEGGKARELDRSQWANIDRLMYEFRAHGRGEYLFEEPIYFGQAFSTPPTLAYSTITDQVEGEAVIPNRVVPPKDYRRNADQYGLGTHSQGTNPPPILDPSFEVQGQYVPLMGSEAQRIPVTSEIVEASPFGDWPNEIRVVWDRDGYTAQNTWDTRQPGYVNSWVQTDEVRGRWSISGDKERDYGVGARGKYSAKFTVVDPGSTNWLIPIGWDTWFAYDTFPNYPDYPGAAHWCFITLVTEGEFVGTGEPPVMFGWNGTASVWSDTDCEFEAWEYCFWADETNSDWWDYSYMPQSYGSDVSLLYGDMYTDHASPSSSVARLGSDNKVTVPIVGGEWNDISFYLPRDRNQWQPMNYSVGGPGLIYETFRFRLNNAVAGQVVYLDNIYLWPDVKNIYVPMVTVGVAEWVQDEHGAYIGAKLWVKVGDV